MCSCNHSTSVTSFPCLQHFSQILYRRRFALSRRSPDWSWRVLIISSIWCFTSNTSISLARNRNTLISSRSLCASIRGYSSSEKHMKVREMPRKIPCKVFTTSGLSRRYGSVCREGERLMNLANILKWAEGERIPTSSATYLVATTTTLNMSTAMSTSGNSANSVLSVQFLFSDRN